VGGIKRQDELRQHGHSQRWLSTPQGKATRSLVQGLKGDPTYLLVGGPARHQASLRHQMRSAYPPGLRCAPGTTGANKFVCPCHGSQYDATGKVGSRRRSRLSLALANVRGRETTTVFS